MADEQPAEMSKLPPESYTVGWICAIPCELTAARESLDACYEQLESQAKYDENNYILGRMGKHNVAIACLPEYGTNRAAIVAKSMQSIFPNLRFGVMVGVGGGVPSPENDIRLGDIAVSLPSTQGGGVIQYDLGRREVDGFHRRGALNKPPVLLRTAISNLRAMRKLPQEITSLVNETFGGDEDLEEEWTYPSNSKDVLYKATHKHIDKNPDCNAYARDPTGVVTRDPRRSTNPRIHYGNIGSGNSVIKDALERDFLAKRDSKTATRALADTLRQEVLFYKSQQEIRVHCSFPGTFYTEQFMEEQIKKPALLKELEGTNTENCGLTAAKMAEVTISGLKQGRFFITMDMETELLFNNMRGPSPRYWSVYD